MHADLFMNQLQDHATSGFKNSKMESVFSDILNEDGQLKYPILFEESDLKSLFGPQ